MTLMTNPITSEIREIRHRLAAEFDNDLGRIFADLQRKEKASGRVVIDRRGERVATDHHPIPRSSDGDYSEAENQSSPSGNR